MSDLIYSINGISICKDSLLRRVRENHAKLISQEKFIEIVKRAKDRALKQGLDVSKVKVVD